MRFLPLILVAAVLVGCGDKFDENYKTEVKLTPEQEKQREENMAGQQMPGQAPAQGGGSTPGTLTGPGKSK
jgi:hypothetical protein